MLYNSRFVRSIVGNEASSITAPTVFCVLPLALWAEQQDSWLTPALPTAIVVFSLG